MGYFCTMSPAPVPGNVDTIAALATPPGTASIAVIRLSGTRAVAIAGDVFRGKVKDVALDEAPSHTVHYGRIVDGDMAVDEVLVTVFRAPRSYTGEDVVEISCHGSPFVAQKILHLLIRRGARQAGPGEFTLRAFLNGRLDLAQAEAVADLIASDSDAALRLALNHVRGGYSADIKKLRDELVHFASLLELELDFAEEDVEFADRGKLMGLVDTLLEKVRRLAASFEQGRALRLGVPVVIAGKPNAGKSTLLNALVNEDRAIVSDQPGTTRDVIEEAIQFDGILFRFMDTAGLRATREAVESMGVQKTKEKLRQSTVALYVFDITAASPDDVRAEAEELLELKDHPARLVLVANKSDLAAQGRIAAFAKVPGIVIVSAKEKAGLDRLIDTLTTPFRNGAGQAGTVVTSARHYEAFLRVIEALQRTYEGLSGDLPTDLVATDLRHALHHLGTITGEITTDDLLKNIFEKFCIGK